MVTPQQSQISHLERVIVIVQSVQLHHPNEQCIAQISIWKERNWYTCLIIHVQHVHVEVFTIQLKAFKA